MSKFIKVHPVSLDEDGLTKEIQERIINMDYVIAIWPASAAHIKQNDVPMTKHPDVKSILQMDDGAEIAITTTLEQWELILKL